MSPSEIMSQPHWVNNFRSALAHFIQEELPVNDIQSDWANDAAWRIARELEDRFLREFTRLQPRAGK